MNIRPIFSLFGILLCSFSAVFLVPALVGYIFNEINYFSFILVFFGVMLLGLLMWLPNKNSIDALKISDGFIVTAMFWFVLGIVGAIPFIAYGISPVNAFFESTSGITTTGATVLVGLDGLPKSLLIYRQMLQWVGGMGLIILVVAIMPTLGIGGGQLFKMEVPSFESSQRLTPRITQNAKALWQIYLFLTISCLLAYLISGMGLFDAFAHALSTVAIGGFSTHDASIGYFDSFAVEVVCIIFMLMSATSFSLHYAALYERKFLKYLYSEELKFFLSVIAIFLTLTIICFATFSMLDWDTLRKSIFQTISIVTTSGFTIDDYSLWPGYIPFLLLVGAFIGACSGSVGGGLKSWRVLIILDQARQEIIKTIHPNAVVTSRIGKKVVDASISEKVWGFFAVYVITFIVLLVLVLMSGLDFESSFSAVGATLNNLGPGLGEVSSNYESLSSFTKIVLSLAMILGRLEIFTLLVLLTPAFWKR